MVGNLIVTQEGAIVAEQLDTTAIATLLSLLVPLAVSAITKRTASEGLKSVVNIVATAVVATLALWINPGDIEITWAVVANTMLASFVASLVAYKGIWKPTGVTGTVAAATERFGIGTPPAPTMETDEKGMEER